MKTDFEVLPHTADIKIRVYGETLKDLFRHAVIGMFQVIRPKISDCRIENERVICDALPERHVVEVRAFDYESLLVDFLSDVLYLSDIYNEAYLDVYVQELSDFFIKATVCGAKVTGFEVVEIKAVTYHELAIQKIDDIWQTDIVFDI